VFLNALKFIKKINPLVVFFLLMFIPSTLIFSEIFFVIRATDSIKKVGYSVPKYFSYKDIRNNTLELDGMSEHYLSGQNDEWQIQKAAIDLRVPFLNAVIVGFTTTKGDTFSVLLSTSQSYPGEFIRFKGQEKVESQQWPELNFKNSVNLKLNARITNDGIAVRIDQGPERLLPGSGAGQSFNKIIFRSACYGGSHGKYGRPGIKKIQVKGERQEKRPFQLNLDFNKKLIDLLYGLLLSSVLCGLLIIVYVIRVEDRNEAKARALKAALFAAASLAFEPFFLIIAETFFIFSIFLFLYSPTQSVDRQNYRKNFWIWKDWRAIKTLALSILFFGLYEILQWIAQLTFLSAPNIKVGIQTYPGKENITYHPYCVMTDIKPPYDMTFKARIHSSGLLRVDLNRQLSDETMLISHMNQGGFSSFFFSPGYKAGSSVYSDSLFGTPTNAVSIGHVPENHDWFDVHIRNYPPLITAEVQGSGGSVGRGSLLSTPKFCFIGFRDPIDIKDIKVVPVQKNKAVFIDFTSKLSSAISVLLFFLVVGRLTWRYMAGNLSSTASMFKLEVLLPILPLLLISFLHSVLLRDDFYVFTFYIIRWGSFLAILFAFVIYKQRSAKYTKIKWRRTLADAVAFTIILIWLTPYWLPGPVAKSYWTVSNMNLPIRDMYIADMRATHNNFLLYQQRFAAREIDPDDKSYRRIFLFGGSQAYGAGVDDPDKTITAVFERVLNERYGYLGRFQAVNAAVPQGTLRNCYINLENVVKYYNPEVVIFNSVRNDFYYYNGSDEAYTKVARSGKYDPEIPTLFEPLYRHARVMFFPSNRGFYSTNGLYKIYVENLKRVQDLCRNLNLRYAFVNEPWPVEPDQSLCAGGEFCYDGASVSAFFKRTHRYLIERSIKGDLPMVDLMDLFAKHREEWLFTDRIHLSERGQELFATGLAEEIVKRWPNPPSESASQKIENQSLGEVK